MPFNPQITGMVGRRYRHRLWPQLSFKITGIRTLYQKTEYIGSYFQVVWHNGHPSEICTSGITGFEDRYGRWREPIYILIPQVVK